MRCPNCPRCNAKMARRGGRTTEDYVIRVKRGEPYSCWMCGSRVPYPEWVEFTRIYRAGVKARKQ